MFLHPWLAGTNRAPHIALGHASCIPLQLMFQLRMHHAQTPGSSHWSPPLQKIDCLQGPLASHTDHGVSLLHHRCRIQVNSHLCPTEKQDTESAPNEQKL